MDGTILRYDHGSEFAQNFWRTVPAQGAYLTHVGRTTIIEMDDVLRLAKGEGVQIPDTHMMWELDNDGDRSLITTINAARRGEALLWLSECKRRAIVFDGDEDTEHEELQVWEYHFSISAASEADLRFYREAFISNLPPVPEPRPVPDTRVLMDFSLAGRNGGANTFTRTIDAHAWGEISRNYSAAAGERLGRLFETSPSDLNGKVGVLYGPPGTGKTHLLRCLARMWRAHAKFTYITDPKRFFSEPQYMLDLILNQFSSGTCNVVLVEDAESYIAARDRKTAQANALQEDTLTTLLNLGDGMLGQGLNMKMIFTTNAPDQAIDPAVIRPGRCFMNLEVPALSSEESAAWLAAHGVEDTANGGMVLADLYAVLNEDR